MNGARTDRSPCPRPASRRWRCRIGPDAPGISVRSKSKMAAASVAARPAGVLGAAWVAALADDLAADLAAALDFPPDRFFPEPAFPEPAFPEAAFAEAGGASC